MYTFRRLQLKKMPSIIGWYLVIDNSTDLLELTMKVQKTKAEKAFADEFNVISKKQNHPADRLNVAINSLSDINGAGWVNSLADLFHKTWYAQRELLEQGYILLFNRNFGYSIDKDDEYYVTLDEYTSDKILFPDYKKRRSIYPMARWKTLVCKSWGYRRL